MLLDFDDLAEPRRLTQTLGIRVDARNPTSIELPEGMDQIYACLMMDGRIEARLQFGALGTVTRRHWIELIQNVVPAERLVEQCRKACGAIACTATGRRCRHMSKHRLRLEHGCLQRNAGPIRDSHFGKLAQFGGGSAGPGSVERRTCTASCRADDLPLEDDHEPLPGGDGAGHPGHGLPVALPAPGRPVQLRLDRQLRPDRARGP